MHIRFLKIIFTISLSYLWGQNMTAFTLCEGNFGSANASLWSFGNSFGDISGPIHWDENSNPLGDVGQSLTIYNQTLFILMNNSHSIEVMNLSGDYPEYETTIDLPNASPRYMVTVDAKGYISSWNLNAVLVLDLNNMDVIDTIPIDGIPEYIVSYEAHLYVSVPNKSDWTSNDQILKIDINNHTIVDSFTVEPGPNTMVINDSFLYVSSSSYDDVFNRYSGTSSINLTNGEIERFDAGQTNYYGSDIFNYQNNVYQIFDGGLVPLNNDLSPDTTAKIGDFNSLYSASAYGDFLYLGISDYTAPDTVLVLDNYGNIVADYIVSAIPGSFGFYEKDQTAIDNNELLPIFSSIKNYPNPFNPSTNIEITLNNMEPYKLYICDISGRKIEEFKIRSAATKTQNIIWDASLFSSGIYFAVLEQDNKKTISKLSLIK